VLTVNAGILAIPILEWNTAEVEDRDLILSSLLNIGWLIVLAYFAELPLQPQIVVMRGGPRFMHHQYLQHSPIPLFLSRAVEEGDTLMTWYGDQIPYALGSSNDGTGYPA
jgi:hypothetical protein